jgi:hypothetical protein
MEHFPGMYTKGAGCLILFTEAMNKAQTEALDLHTVSADNILDPFVQAKQDICGLHMLKVVTDP